MASDGEQAPPEQSTTPATSPEFRCGSCGGAMAFNATQGCMLCDYCGSTRPVSEDDGPATIAEYDLEHGLALHAKRGYGVAVRTLACATCGAVVSRVENETANSCDFCGSPRVVEQKDHEQPIRPESVVPFRIDRATAKSEFSKWLGTLWLRPSDLKRLASVSDMTGMYVPYWCFDAKVQSRWTAEAGYYYYTTETYTTVVNGRTQIQTRTVRRIRWEPASGRRSDVYDDLLVCASKGLSREMARKLEPFETRQLAAYDPDYLAGWHAEEYSVPLNGGWKFALERMENHQRTRCSADVPGDTQRFLHVSNRFSDERFKHILLPVWISAYRYRDRSFQFLVNGQTGEVTGNAPWSYFKIALLTIAVTIAVVGVFALLQR